MGLYDTIRIEFKVSDWLPNIPISDEELKSLEYQTKSIYSLLDEYLIDVAGHFWDIGSKFLQKNKDDKIIHSTGTRYELYDGSIMTMPFSGDVVFYSSNEKYIFIEFLAVFHKATMSSLHCLRLTERVVA